MTKEELILEKYHELTKRYTCEINLDPKEVSILEDKLGGIPYLPVGEKYPIDGEGKKMGLFMQVNLGNLKLENFPQKGILEIFISTNEKIFEYEQDGNIFIKVYDEGLEYKKDLEYVPLDFLDGTYELSTEKVETIRSFDDESIKILRDLIKEYNADNMPLDFEEKIDDFATRCGDHIGGYINLSHYDNSADYVSNDDECLFYINTDGFANMGAIYAMFMTIKKEDLKNGNFENAEFNISYD